MPELAAQLAEDDELAAAYRARPRGATSPTARASSDVAEIAGISAGGMPTRVKCLHALAGHALAAGPGREPDRRPRARARRLVARACASASDYSAPAAIEASRRGRACSGCALASPASPRSARGIRVARRAAGAHADPVRDRRVLARRLRHHARPGRPRKGAGVTIADHRHRRRRQPSRSRGRGRRRHGCLGRRRRRTARRRSAQTSASTAPWSPRSRPAADTARAPA